MKQTNRFGSLIPSIWRFLSLTVLLLVFETTSAQVVFRAGVDVGVQTNAGTGPDELQKNGVKLYVTQGAFGTSQYRIAKSQTLTVSSDVGNITKIVFTSTADLSKNYGFGGFAYQSGYSWGNETAQWLGDASSVAFTATNNQVRFLKVEVYIDGEEPTGDIDWTSSPEEPLSVAKALELGNQLAIGESSDKPVYVKGVVTDIMGYNSEIVDYYISDDGSATSKLYIYHGDYYHNEDFSSTAEKDIQVNDSIVLIGVITKYWNNNDPIVELKNSHLYSLSGFELYKVIDGIYYAVNPRTKMLDVIKNDTIENFYSGDVTIPAVVTMKGTDFAVNSIADEAFAGCENLTSVFVSDGISYIQYRAFAGCIALKSIDLPGSILYIDSQAFSGCKNIKATLYGPTASFLSGEAFSEIVLDETVTTIRAWAFANCTGLRTINIPKSVTSVGENAFEYCNQLTDVTIDCPSVGLWFKGKESVISVTLGKSVSSVENGAFDGCNNLSIARILCPSVGSWFSGNESLYQVTLGDSVKHICDNAFSRCSNLRQITIPDGVTDIGSYSFYGCKSLVKINIPNSIISIGNGAFSECSGLQSISIPEGVKDIAHFTFDGCNSLTDISIPVGIVNIGSYAFRNCSRLSYITIPNTVTSIGILAFRNCSNLQGCYFTGTSQLNSIGEGAFYGCTNLSYLSLNCPIVGTWFSDVKSLKSIEFGESVTSISSRAFADCDKLYRISIAGNVTTIGDNAFHQYALREVILNCPVVKNWFKKFLTIEYVEFGDSVTTINANAFYWCSGLETAKGGKNITTIGDCAFSLCSSLKTIEFGNRLRSIGNYAFDRCSSLTSFSISEGLVSIGNYAFDGCSNLSDFDVPEGVTSIGDFAFQGCKKMKYINLPNSLTTIGRGAFNLCESIDYIYIPENVTSIGANAFMQCRNLSEVYINCPIVDSWFEGKSIKILTIGDSVQTIREDAFRSCGGGFTTVKIGYGVTSIGNDAFYGCKNIVDLSLNCPYVGSWFKGLQSIKHIEIGDSVKIIDDEAFSNCKNLEELLIGNNVTTIGKKAFYNCNSLPFIDIPRSTISIDDDAFNGCSSLMIELGKGLTSIGNRAFYNCKNIFFLSIPNSIKHIGNYAFYGCLAETVYCHIEQPLEDCFPFGHSYSCLLPQGSTLYVPNTALEAYKKSPSWNVFTYILPFNYNPDNIEEVTGSSNTRIKVYSLSGQYLKTIDAINQLNVVMPPGIYIVGGKKITVK